MLNAPQDMGQPTLSGGQIVGMQDSTLESDAPFVRLRSPIYAWRAKMTGATKARLSG